MKIASAIGFAICLQVCFSGFGQKITLRFKNTPLEKVFREIQQQSGYLFIYNDKIIADLPLLSITTSNADLQKVMELCLKDRPLLYELVESTVIIKRKAIIIPSGVLTMVSGVVASEEGELLESVTVQVKNFGKAVMTDSKGEFFFAAIPDDAMLLISSVGFGQQEISIKGRTILDIHLKYAVTGLDETIVKGYYSTLKRFNTGSTGKITAGQVANQPVSNVLGAIEGRVAGLFITQETGLPGGSYSTRIRGTNSLANGNEPLYVIDNVPLPSVTLSSYGIGAKINGGGSAMNNIELSDISSIEVLKDADATAIYGSRGANGVILITTKKAQSSTTAFAVNAYESFGTVPTMLPLLTTSQYLAMRREALANDKQDAHAYDYDLVRWDTSRYTDWQEKLIGGTATTTNLQATIGGGSKRTRFLLGAGFRREGTVFPQHFENNKTNFSISINHGSAKNKFNADFSAFYLADRNRLPGHDLTNDLLYLPPDAPSVYDPAGGLNWEGGTFDNPFGGMLQKFKADGQHVLANVLLRYKLTKAFFVKLSLGYTSEGLREIITFPASSLNPVYRPLSGYSIFSHNNSNTWIAEPQLNFHRNTGKNDIDLLAGLTFQQTNSFVESSNADGFASDAVLENIQDASSISVLQSFKSIYRYDAVFLRIGYIRDSKYILNITGRRDGSSRFGPGRRFANFGAAGLGWIFSKEKIIEKGIPFLSYGKIRASYGITGNDQIGDYQYLDIYGPVSTPYLGQAGLQPLRLFNNLFGWETTRKLEVGLDLGFFKDRLEVTTAIYRNVSGGEVAGMPLAPSTGFNSIQNNLPVSIENRGIEIEINIAAIQEQLFSCAIFGNMTIPRNRLLAFPDIANSVYNNTYEVGAPLGILKAFHLTGVNAETGIYEFEGKGGNPVAQPSYPSDLQGSYKLTQELYGGFGSVLKIKNFECNIFFQFVKQTGRNWKHSKELAPGMFGNQPVWVLERWQEAGDNTATQRFTQDYGSDAYNGFVTAQYNSDLTAGNASFIRLKNLSLTYSWPSRVLQKVHIKSCFIYVQCQNLFTGTGYKGFDPETNQTNKNLPPLRVLSIGMGLNL